MHSRNRQIPPSITSQATGQADAQATAQADEVVNALWTKAFKELIERASQNTGQATGQAAAALIAYFVDPKTKEIQDALGPKHRETFLDNSLMPVLEAGLLERTIPDKPTSPNQMYRLNTKGREWLSMNT